MIESICSPDTGSRSSCFLPLIVPESVWSLWEYEHVSLEGGPGKTTKKRQISGNEGRGRYLSKSFKTEVVCVWGN